MLHFLSVYDAVKRLNVSRPMTTPSYFFSAQKKTSHQLRCISLCSVCQVDLSWFSVCNVMFVTEEQMLVNYMAICFTKNIDILPSLLELLENEAGSCF